VTWWPAALVTFGLALIIGSLVVAFFAPWPVLLTWGGTAVLIYVFGCAGIDWLDRHIQKGHERG
jgi:hypothetical protein